MHHIKDWCALVTRVEHRRDTPAVRRSKDEEDEKDKEEDDEKEEETEVRGGGSVASEVMAGKRGSEPGNDAVFCGISKVTHHRVRFTRTLRVGTSMVCECGTVGQGRLNCLSLVRTEKK